MKNTIMKIVDRIDCTFEFIEKYLTGFALIAFTIIIFANVIGRYVFLKGFTWAEEASRFLNIWLVFIAISAGLKYKSHIGIDAFVQLAIPIKYHRAIGVLINIVVLIFSILIGYQGFGLVSKVGRMKQASAALQIPMAIPYAAIPVGMTMLAVRAILEILKDIVGYETVKEVK
jgi:C4-dicarboxylate transporter DctQ subunit